MRILIVGAGGTGGFYGAWLLDARRDVTFLVRPQRAQQLREHGLQLSSPKGNLTLASPRTITADSLNETFDLILLSCKAYDLSAAMHDFAPAVGSESAILPLLNGMAHMDLLDQQFGRTHVLGGSTTVSAARDDDGRILHLNTLDTLQFGDRDQPGSQRMQRIAETLTVPGYIAQLRPVILEDMWMKWLALSAAASLTCMLRAFMADIINAGATPLLEQMLTETSSIAAAEGFPPSPAFREIVLQRFIQPGSLFTTSMHRDIEAGRPIEAHQIVGDLLDHGRRHNLPTPLLAVAHAHLRCYEERRKRELTA